MKFKCISIDTLVVFFFCLSVTTPTLTDKKLSDSSFMNDLENLLKWRRYDIYLNYDNFQLKMIREFVSWVGIFTSSREGLALLKEFRIFDCLNKMVNPKEGSMDHILIQILHSLDFQSYPNTNN